MSDQRSVVLSGDDFVTVMRGLNTLSCAMEVLLYQHPEAQIVDLDGDPYPEARARWDTACKEAHKALARAQYAKET